MSQLANLRTSLEQEFQRGVEAPALLQRFAHIVSVSGSQAVAVVEASEEEARIEIGSLVKIPTPSATVVGLVSALSSPIPDGSKNNDQVALVELNLAGEIIDRSNGHPRFRRGVANLPTMGDAVYFADRDDLACVYVQPDASTIEVGSLYQDSTVPARLIVDELFGKHFIIVGTTGCGKSSALTKILQSVLQDHGNAHILVLDIHSEYAAAFGDMAERISPANLRLPFWLLNFQELSASFTSTDSNRDAEVEILSEAVLTAKRRYAEANANGRLRRTSDSAITVETPTPFRLSDVVAYIDDQMGKLDRVQGVLPYRRLKSRIEALVSDGRYSFMFGSLTVEDTMTDVLARIFRVPAEGKPITVLDLASVPSEILDVVISLLSRLAFDLAVWAEGAMPILLVCEEAHRYAPAGDGGKFLPTRQALSRIAKEGRKYGVSLALVTQRPSELDTTILSQCSTMVAMRLSTERDQQVMRANTHDSAMDLLDFLPLLGDREGIVLGQGVAMPMRIRFSDIAATAVPTTRHLGFSSSWKLPNMDREQLEQTVARWRASGRRDGR